MKFRASVLTAMILCVSCGSANDSTKDSRGSDGLNDKPKVILAYEVKRQKGENLRTISERYQVSLSLLERFNPREGHGRRKNVIYVPMSAGAFLKSASGKNKPRIVKLMRDPFLRPVKMGNWAAAEEEDFQTIEDWLTPDEAQRLSFPVDGYISSGFSWRWNRFHKGLDIAARSGSPILAAQDGKVVFRGWKAGYGLLVIIEHRQGRTYYAHCRSTEVKADQKVSRGDLIARVGATGHSRGAHLHFEYRDNNNQPIDPTPFLLPPCSHPASLSAQPTKALPGAAIGSAQNSLCLAGDI